MVTGTGTSGDPFVLSTFADLELIGTTGYALSAYYKLGADIDASATQNPAYNGGAGWLPIGISGTSFSGYFDGNGYTISNLYINRPTTNNVGFIGYFTGDSKYLKNLNITNANIIGQENVGILIGYFTCDHMETGLEISDCISSGNITGSISTGGIIGNSRRGSITRCSSTADIVGGQNVGGIIGQGGEKYSSLSLRVTITYPSYRGTITATGDTIGMIAGYGACITVTDTNISTATLNASPTSSNVGGICGYAYISDFTRCTCSINISGYNCVGGIVGNEQGDGTTSYCVTTGNISGNSSVGGICGNVGHAYSVLRYYTTITQCKSTGNITATTSNAGGIFGAGRTYLSHSYSTSSVTCPTSCGGAGGTLTQGSITKCYSTGLITGTTNAKGFLGVNSGGSSSDCYWDIETSGKTTSAVGTGKTTVEMQTESTFVDWDFVNTWTSTDPCDRLQILSSHLNEVYTGALAAQPTPANVSLEGYDFSLLMGSGVIGAVGNLLISGLTGEVLVEMVIVAPSGEVFMSGINPYLPQEGDIELYDLTPKKIAKKFVSYVKFKLKTPDDNTFLIKTAKAKMDNETIPITITRNGTAVNTCQMTIDTNHLRDGWKKLDITIIIEGNSNQFRRYIRIL